MSYTSGLGYTPIFQIDQGDNDITGGFQDRLVSIAIESYSANGLGDHCSIMVDDRDWLLTSPSTSGGEGSATTITIYLGYKEGGLYEQGRFTINECVYLYPPKGMELHGNGLDMSTAAKSPVVRNFDGKTLGQIVGDIAQTAGVTPSVDPSLASKTIPYLNVNSSHMHLLQELERRFDGMAKFSDGHLSFTKRGSGTTVSGSGFGDFTLTGEDLKSFRITENNRTAYSKVRVSYLDRTKNQLTWVSSTVPPLGGGTVPHMVKQPFPSQQEAQDHANATMASLNRGTRIGTLELAKGDPSIKGGMKFTIAGTRDGVDGDYTISTATHIFVKDQGIATTLQFNTDGEGTSGSSGGSVEAPATPEITGQSFFKSNDGYSPGASIGPGGLLGHV